MISITPPEGMEFTPGQADAIPRIAHVVEHGGILVVAGYAGTGKSTLLGATVKAMQQHGTDFQTVCPTGRAASRVRETGVGASTIHKWKYRPRLSKDGELLGFDPVNVDISGRFTLIVDEGSMISPTVLCDIATTVLPSLRGRSVVIFGDGFQLPPVLSYEERQRYGNDFSALDPKSLRVFATADRVDMLDVVRQAAGNPVLALATALRQGADPPLYLGNDLIVTRSGRSYMKSAVRAAPKAESRVCLTWMNRDRDTINRAARAALGYMEPLEEGDRLVVVQNHTDTELCNGDLVEIAELYETFNSAYADIYMATIKVGKSHINTPIIRTQDEVDTSLSVFARARKVAKMFPEIGDPLIVDYGYCLTTHKAQGSEWDEVLVYAPDYMIERLGESHAKRWLYTALTRAKKRAVFTGGHAIAKILGG